MVFMWETYVVPNLRGFGDSTHPGEMRTSGTMGDLVGDLVCVLENAGVSQAICMGHDWGSAVCYEAARARPDIFIGVAGAVVPYLPAAGEHLEVKDLVSFLPKMTYQLFFDLKTEEAIAELDADIRRTMRGTLRTIDSPPPESFLTSNSTFLGAWNGIEVPPVPFFSKEEEDYFVKEMSAQGFRNTLQFYTSENRHQSWKLAHEQGNHTLPQPVLTDPVADWMVLQRVARSADFIPNLEVGFVEAAHWPHLERPEEFNAIVRQWLEGYSGIIRGGHGKRTRIGMNDEL
ncbi:hypothetical protein NMY22_g365 [Coprinellus aureogranulatus]|nr:hypothetical protein NMY22_g365 [Coprinellus aureogranulatus]